MKKVCFVCWDFSLVGGIESVVTLLSEEFSKYYDATAKTINITALAKDRGIQGITGEVTITINVDTKIQS